ncbi:MAG TPA: SCP2 sterol-binding domain-containing protein [Anaerolineales bacterium]
MSFAFPSPSWLEAASQALNQDRRYAQVAQQWEGDCLFQVEDNSTGAPLSWLYFDLWHGKCRRAQVFEPPAQDMPRPAFTISATLKHFLQVLGGQLDPIQAMLTRRLRVHGSMGYMLRNIPIVLDFVRVVSSVEIEPVHE